MSGMSGGTGVMGEVSQQHGAVGLACNSTPINQVRREGGRERERRREREREGEGKRGKNCIRIMVLPKQKHYF